MRPQRILIYLLLLLTPGLSHGNRLLLTYPVASRQMQFLMRNLAVILADNGYHVTVLSTDGSKFLDHPNITSHVLDVSVTFSTPGPECSEQLGEVICKHGDIAINTVSNFWGNIVVDEVFRDRESFDALIVPSVFNEFCFPFVFNSTLELILLKSPTYGLEDEPRNPYEYDKWKFSIEPLGNMFHRNAFFRQDFMQMLMRPDHPKFGGDDHFRTRENTLQQTQMALLE